MLGLLRRLDYEITAGNDDPCNDIGQDGYPGGKSGKGQKYSDDSDDYRIHIQVLTEAAADAAKDLALG